MKTSERIFTLIEQGDMESILADKVLLERFHELMERDLLNFVNDRLLITKKGEKLRSSGRQWDPFSLEEDRPNLLWNGREQIQLLRSSSLLVMSTWLLVILYLIYHCRLLCPEHG